MVAAHTPQDRQRAERQWGGLDPTQIFHARCHRPCATLVEPLRPLLTSLLQRVLDGTTAGQTLRPSTQLYARLAPVNTSYFRLPGSRCPCVRLCICTGRDALLRTIDLGNLTTALATPNAGPGGADGRTRSRPSAHVTLQRSIVAAALTAVRVVARGGTATAATRVLPGFIASPAAPTRDGKLTNAMREFQWQLLLFMRAKTRERVRAGLSALAALACHLRALADEVAETEAGIDAAGHGAASIGGLLGAWPRKAAVLARMAEDQATALGLASRSPMRGRRAEGGLEEGEDHACAGGTDSEGCSARRIELALALLHMDENLALDMAIQSARVASGAVRAVRRAYAGVTTAPACSAAGARAAAAETALVAVRANADAEARAHAAALHDAVVRAKAAEGAIAMERARADALGRELGISKSRLRRSQAVAAATAKAAQTRFVDATRDAAQLRRAEHDKAVLGQEADALRASNAALRDETGALRVNNEALLREVAGLREDAAQRRKALEAARAAATCTKAGRTPTSATRECATQAVAMTCAAATQASRPTVHAFQQQYNGWIHTEAHVVANALEEGKTVRKGGWHKATQCPDRIEVMDHLLERVGLFSPIVEANEVLGDGIQKPYVDNYLFRRYNREGCKMARNRRELNLPVDVVNAFRQLQKYREAGISVHNDPDWSALCHINSSVY